MYCVKKMTEDLYWVGASERRLKTPIRSRTA